MAFKPGKSGNPQGRPQGALNQTTRAGQELLDGEARNLPGGVHRTCEARQSHCPEVVPGKTYSSAPGTALEPIITQGGGDGGPGRGDVSPPGLFVIFGSIF